MGLHSFFFGKTYTDLELADMIREGGNAQEIAVRYLLEKYVITIIVVENRERKTREVKGFQARTKEILRKGKIDKKEGENIAQVTWVDFLIKIKGGLSPNSMWAYFNTILNRKIILVWKQTGRKMEEFSDEISVEEEGLGALEVEIYLMQIESMRLCSETIATSATENQPCRKKCKEIIAYESKDANQEQVMPPEDFAAILGMEYDNYRQCKKRCIEYIKECIAKRELDL